MLRKLAETPEIVVDYLRLISFFILEFILNLFLGHCQEFFMAGNRLH